MRMAAKWVLATACLTSLALAAGPRPRISLELLTRPGLPLTASQQWYKVLTDLGISGLQIRPSGPGDEMGISKQGDRAAPQYKVVGILATNNVLHLPGGKFNPNDVAGLRKWLDALADQGPEGVTEPRSAFGLVPRQLAEVNEDLKRTVSFSTLGMSTAKAVARVGAGLKHALILDDAAKQGLAGATVADELSGLSSGTALAAILRPAGLALRPDRPAGGDLQYRIGSAASTAEAWPVGWKPKGRPNEVLPALFDFLNVEIQDTSVAEAVDAIHSRFKVPFVFDSCAMAQHKVDPATAAASVPDRRMTYSLILNKVLLQAKLKYELHVDEADKPFVWITTVKPVR